MNTNEDVPGWHHLPENPFNPHAWIIGEPQIGKGTWVGAFTVIDGSGGLTIGENCDISAGAQIYTHSTVRRCLNKDISGKSVHDIERAPVTIGSNVHIGAGAVILMGTEIGDKCVIAAGCVVPQNTIIPNGSIAKGVPCEIIEDAALKFISSKL